MPAATTDGWTRRPSLSTAAGRELAFSDALGDIADRLDARAGSRSWGERLRSHGTRLLNPAAHVSVIIPSAGHLDPFGAPLLEGALELVGGRAPVVVVVTNRALTEPAEAACKDWGATIVHVSSDGFNFSRAVNAGVAAARTSHVLLLNDDVGTPPSSTWLQWWLAQRAELSGVALRWPDGRTAYAGIKWGAPGNMPEHLFLGHDPATLEPEPPTLAVTGAALLVRRDLFHAVGGFSEDLPLNYNDIDFCLQALALGARPRQFNQLVLTHRESASRGDTPPTASDYRIFEERCGAILAANGVDLSVAVAMHEAGVPDL